MTLGSEGCRKPFVCVCERNTEWALCPPCVTVNPAYVIYLNACVYSSVVYVNLRCSVFTLSDTSSPFLCVFVLQSAVFVLYVCVCVWCQVSGEAPVFPTQSAEGLISGSEFPPLTVLRVSGQDPLFICMQSIKYVLLYNHNGGRLAGSVSVSVALKGLDIYILCWFCILNVNFDWWYPKKRTKVHFTSSCLLNILNISVEYFK